MLRSGSKPNSENSVLGRLENIQDAPRMLLARASFDLRDGMGNLIFTYMSVMLLSSFSLSRCHCLPRYICETAAEIVSSSRSRAEFNVIHSEMSTRILGVFTEELKHAFDSELPLGVKELLTYTRHLLSFVRISGFTN
ncbi:plant/T32G24-2 protein [Sesbania bispinosa]|nr:plant/T32G24-2 protein [Sesbania bispinosa]